MLFIWKSWACLNIQPDAGKCVPVDPPHEWMAVYYRFGQKMSAFYRIEYGLLVCEMPSSVMVATVIMTAMGQFAAELSESVRNLIRERGTIFCGRFSYKCKRRAV